MKRKKERTAAVSCRAGMHAWSSWDKPYWHDKRWFQSRTCRRCGKVQVQGVPNYRPPAEDDLAALTKLADRLGLPEAGKPIDAPGTVREPLDLGEIDPALAGTVVHLRCSGPTLGGMLDYVDEAATIMKDLNAGGCDAHALSARINAWLCEAWGIGSAEMVGIMGRLDAHSYLVVFAQTAKLVTDGFWRLAGADVGGDPPDLSVFRRALTEA